MQHHAAFHMDLHCCESTRLGVSPIQRFNKLNNDKHTSKSTFYFLLTGTSFTTTNPSCNVTSKPRDSCTGELILIFCITVAHVFIPSTPELDHAKSNCSQINGALVLILPFHSVYLHIGTSEQVFTASRRRRAQCLNRSLQLTDVVE